MDATEALSELRYLELELSDVMSAAAGRMRDTGAADDVRLIAEQHRRHASEAAAKLEAMGAVDAQPEPHFRQHLRATEREMLHARDEDGVFNGLADVERYDVRLHEHILAAADVPSDVADLVARQTEAERVSLRYLEARAPEAGTEVRGVRTMPPREEGS